ncbi:MAG TPA: hypothetical protein VHW03_05305 [Chthoniobacterales bacterium]|nr:hypothetical protein [Chthoniobacterales bacterium]
MLHQWPLKCLALGLLVTLAQVALAIAFANPEGSLGERWRSLVQHDSYWFANIIDRGYNTTLPPIDHKEMEVSNVAFFPAYPWLAETVARLTGLDTYAALLVTAEAATWGFWTYFFLLAERWELGVPLQVFGVLAIVAHPAGFYLVAGYSESLFLASLVGLIYWSTREARGAPGLAVLHGIALSATRIVGLPCAAFPVVDALFRKGWGRMGNLPASVKRFRTPVLVMLGSTVGGLAFFAYCQVRWGRWDLYMLTQNAGWGIVPDYLAAFRMDNYRWALPPFADTSVVSQFTSALAGGLFLVIAAVELLAAIWERTGWRTRIGFYFCAAVIYYLSLAGVASVQMQSMLRYDLCVHALVVLGLLHFLRQFRVAPVFVRALAMGVAAVAFAAGLALQGFYVWNFTQGNWVA